MKPLEEATPGFSSDSYLTRPEADRLVNPSAKQRSLWSVFLWNLRIVHPEVWADAWNSATDFIDQHYGHRFLGLPDRN